MKSSRITIQHLTPDTSRYPIKQCDACTVTGMGMSDGMLQAMDNIMLVKGKTPQFIAAERQKRDEEEELCAKEASQVKVQQWRKSSRAADSR